MASKDNQKALDEISICDTHYECQKYDVRLKDCYSCKKLIYVATLQKAIKDLEKVEVLMKKHGFIVIDDFLNYADELMEEDWQNGK